MQTFIVAKKDTFVNSMHNIDKEIEIPAGFRAFNILSENQTRYLDNDEICVYHVAWGEVHFGYKGDWEDEKGIG